VACVSFVADYKLPEKSRDRAVWSTVQVLGGLFVFLIAGVAATSRLSNTRQSLGVTDMLFPDRLWGLALKSLPATRWHVCTASWAAMASVCGILWVGGLTYWLPSKTKQGASKSSPFAKALIKAARIKDDDSPDDESKNSDENPVVAQPEKPKIEEPEEKPPSKKTVTECVIVGYTTKDGDLDGLIVATVHGDELHYAGVVPASNDPAVRKDLLKRFGALEAKAPVFPDLEVQATWLKPRLSCEVESAGVDEDQLLKVPEFKGLVFPKKKKPAGEGKDAKDEKDAKAADGDKNAKDGKKAADAKDAKAKDRALPK
jgi:hypothetical protein